MRSKRIYRREQRVSDLFRVVLCIAAGAMAPVALADTTIPTADKKGSTDNPLLQRYEGSFIVAYERQDFGEFTLPLSRLEPVKDKKAGNNNRAHEPKDKKTLEGPYTRLVYLVPEKRSPLEVLRNYQPESDPTLEQMAKLLTEAPELKVLVAGHTDNVGTFEFNMDLSQRRAASVVDALATRFDIDKTRLMPVGVSFASPVASNKTEEGRAKNRRVELVEN